MKNAEDARLMTRALALAASAGRMGNVPVAALVVVDGEVVAQATNHREILHDPTAHAEVLALRLAAQAQQCWRLNEATLYVTLEPCVMCAGAIAQARVGRVVFAGREPKRGAVVSAFTDVMRDDTVITELTAQADAAHALLRSFFRKLRGGGSGSYGEVAELVEGA